LGGIIVAVLAVAFVTCLLVTRDRNDRHTQGRNRHVFRGQGEAVTVAELLADAREKGKPTRLDQPAVHPSEAWLMRPYIHDQFPTVKLRPVVRDRHATEAPTMPITRIY
jgi:hypothetical protein